MWKIRIEQTIFFTIISDLNMDSTLIISCLGTGLDIELAPNSLKIGSVAPILLLNTRTLSILFPHFSTHGKLTTTLQSSIETTEPGSNPNI